VSILTHKEYLMEQQQPAKFRKKPVIIEAMKFEATPESAWAIREWVIAGGGVISVGGLSNGAFRITTLEGDMTVSEGNWVIRGVKGEFYSCQDDIFRMTYEPVE
jgi:hypothetical protein